MDSRAIIQKTDKLGVLIDSQSFDTLLSRGDQNAETLLKYSDSKPFEFSRSPLDTSNNKLKEVSAFIKKYDTGNLSAIELLREKSRSTIAFDYRMQDIEKIGKVIYKKKYLTTDEKEAVILTFIQAIINRFDKMSILITKNSVLLKKRLWLESHFPGCILNILTMEEAKEVMDLFCKYQNKYYISGNHTCNKGYWYWLCFRSKIPNFHVGMPFLDTFSSRFVYLLMSVDEMGFQYYLGVNNDTMNNTIYHFNYFISLVTGIFDSLALYTKKQYNLRFKGNNVPSRTSLNPKVPKEFIKAVRQKNSALSNQIREYANFIRLIYELREVIIHRELPTKTAFEYREGLKTNWRMNFIRIDGDIASFIRSCNDRIQKYEPVTRWGLYKSQLLYFLEPFHFAKSATRTLVAFSNKYLELLGFKSFIKDVKNRNLNDTFARTIELFERDNLGF